MTLPKWDDLTIEDRNLLVAEKVMGFKPGQECDGWMGEQANSSDGWFCQKCGHEGYWGDSFEHEALPPRYAEDLNLALAILERYERVKLTLSEDRRWHGYIQKAPYTAQGAHRNLIDVICTVSLCMEGAHSGVYYIDNTGNAE